MTREKDIEHALVMTVSKLGGLCLKWVCPGFAGVPDRICLLPGGRMIFVEVKRPEGGRIAPLQTAMGNRLRSLGFIVLVIRSREEVKQFFLENGGNQNA